MQEKLKNASAVNFIKPFGPKICAGEKYDSKDDVTDQRAPVNSVQDLYDQFVVPFDVMDEIDNEKVEDFENDFYDYDDRSEYGEDVAAAGQVDLEQYIHSKTAEEQSKKPVEKADEEPAE